MLGLIPAAAVLDMLSVDADDGDLYVREAIAGKRASDHYRGLLDDVRANGMALPILIRTFQGEPWLADGHHRVAVAVDLGLTHLVWTDVPLDVCDEPFNPVLRGDWGPYRPDACAADPAPDPA